MPNLGIYVHIPFCASKCSYCDFYSLPGAPDKLIGGYVKALIRHMDEASRFMGKASKGVVTADTVYFGGGTPTSIGAERLAVFAGFSYFRLWDRVKPARSSSKSSVWSRVSSRATAKVRTVGLDGT